MIVAELEDISKVYRTDEVETLALQGVYLHIAMGEYVAIEGPSGSGKTTLLAILGLVDRPDTGYYHFAGTAVDRLNASERARIRGSRIGFVFQHFNLVPTMTLLENVALPLEYCGVAKRERVERALNALAEVGLSHRTRHRPAQVSGGEKQRTAIARALVTEPALILADEPTGNLDSDSGSAILDLLEARRSRGTALVIATHDPRVRERADRVVHIFDGQIGALPSQVADASMSQALRAVNRV